MHRSPRCLASAIVVISDMVEVTSGHSNFEGIGFSAPLSPTVLDRAAAAVNGGYLERLPLAAMKHGLVDFAEIWHHRLSGPSTFKSESPVLSRRVFDLDTAAAPFRSRSMLNFIAEYGAPQILCVWGLGVSEELLDACRNSIIIYNSIDVPALRVPPEISRHFDLVLTGAQWQSDAVNERHPGMRTAIMPIGPEFASPETFYPTGDAKRYDVVYVAAAQPYKRHDLLFDALQQAPRPLKALCVMGYGEMAEDLRQRAHDMAIDVEFIGPPGVSHAEVNRLINQAKVGVVCGVDDGAPAILTEYMLAGLPVIANAGLKCGLQFIVPETGIVAPEAGFGAAIVDVLGRLDQFAPRRAVLDRWTWPHTIRRLETELKQSPKWHSRKAHPVEGGARPFTHSEGDVLERPDHA